MRALALLALLVGCKDEPYVPEFESNDVRIDGAGGERDPDSLGARSCATADGRLYTVWYDDRDGVNAIWFNRSEDGGVSWRDPVRINKGTFAAQNPSIACDGMTVAIAWEDLRDGELGLPNTYVNVSNDGGVTWNAEANLDGDAWGWYISSAPRVAIAGTYVYVVWSDTRTGAYDVFLAASPDLGATWLEEIRLDNDEEGASYSSWPVIHADETGAVYVAWEEGRNGTSDVYFAASTDFGATFGDDVRLDGDERGTGWSYRPELVASGAEIYVVWYDDRAQTGQHDIWMNWSPDGGVTWLETAARVDSDAEGQANSLYPRVTMHGGAAHIVWEDERQIGYDLFYRQAVAGAFAAYEIQVDVQGVGSHALNPRIAAGDAGVVVVWEDRRHDYGSLGLNDLYYNFSADGGATWQAEDLRLSSSADGSTFAIEASPQLVDGVLVTSFLDGRNGTADVFVSRLALGEKAVTPETWQPESEEE